jgi:hypothetical protein
MKCRDRILPDRRNIAPNTANLLNVPVPKVKKWLKQALNDGKVKKLTKPVRFELINYRQDTIFDLDADREK